MASVVDLCSFTSDQHSALKWFGRKSLDAVRFVVCERSLSGVARPWSSYAQAFDELFRLSPTHCFAARAHDWTSFHEPQLTRGLAHFLSVGSTGQRRARVHAFLKATGAERLPIKADSLCQCDAVAEEGRIDLKVIATTEHDLKIGVVVEAKLGHKITTGQLSRYRKLSRGDADDLLLCVVAPSLTTSSRRALRKNAAWQFHTWRTLLLGLEENLPVEADDDDFRRFRRTMWKEAYGF